MDLANPFRRNREGHAPTPPRKVPAREWAKLYAIGVILLLALLLMAILQFQAESPKGPSPETRTSEAPQATPDRWPDSEPARAPDRSQEAPPERLQELASDFADDKDSIHAAIDWNSQPFLSLMASIRSGVTPEEATKRVEPGITVPMLLQDPAAYRGRFVRCRGRLVTISLKRVDHTTPDGVSHIYLGYLLTPPPEEARVQFFLADRPAGPFRYRTVGEDILYEDHVEVEGVFLRLFRYEGRSLNKGPGQIQTAAVLFGKNLRVIEPPKLPDPRGGFALLVLGGGGVIALVILGAGILSRRQGSASLRMKVHELRKLRESAGKPVAAAQPSAPPDAPAPPGPPQASPPA